MKRLLTVIVVFPISFIIVGILGLSLIDLGGGLLHGRAFNFSIVNWDPQVIPNAAETLNSAVTSLEHLSLKGISREQGFVVAFALIGAVIFAVSCLSEHLYVKLLDARRFFTIPLVFAYGFLIFGCLFNFAADYIGGAIAQTASSPEQKSTAVAQYRTEYSSTMNWIVFIAAVLAAIYLSMRLTRWDGLPWCRSPLPVRKPHQSRRAL